MSNIQIRAWTSRDGWYMGTDERMIFKKSFKKYSIFAKITYLYAKTFYEKVVVDIIEEGENE